MPTILANLSLLVLLRIPLRGSVHVKVVLIRPSDLFATDGVIERLRVQPQKLRINIEDGQVQEENVSEEEGGHGAPSWKKTRVLRWIK